MQKLSIHSILCFVPLAKVLKESCEAPRIRFSPPQHRPKNKRTEENQFCYTLDMEKLKNLNKMPQRNVCEKFTELYGVEMIEITYEDLPLNVKIHFENQSRKFIIPESYKAGNFSKLYRFIHLNGDVTYVGQQDKTYDTNEATERLTYFVDTRDGEITGYLEIRLSLTDQSEYFKEKPFVGFTRTFSAFLNQGLGKRRLEEANAYSLSEHSLPLNSDSLVMDEAKKIWEKLIKDGKAEKYDENGKERFRFIS